MDKLKRYSRGASSFDTKNSFFEFYMAWLNLKIICNGCQIEFILLIGLFWKRQNTPLE